MKALTDAFAPDAWSLMGPKVQKWKTNFENIPQLKNCIGVSELRHVINR